MIRPRTMARRFELVDGGSRKFWQVDVRDDELTVRFGRIGTVGQEKVKRLASAAAATSEAVRLVKEKTGKGYVPALPADLAGLLERLRKAGYPEGAPLPDQLVRLLSWHDGSGSVDHFFSYVCGGNFIASAETAGWFETLMNNAAEEEAPSYFFAGWIPVFENDYSVTCVDGLGSFGHPPGAVVHVDFKGGQSRPFLAPSLAGWFELFVDLLSRPEGVRAYTEGWGTDDDHDEAWQRAVYLADEIVRTRHPGYPIEHTVDDIADPLAKERDLGPLIFLKLEKRIGKQLWRWECDVDGGQVIERLIQMGKSGDSTWYECKSGAEAVEKATLLERAKLAEGYSRIGD